MEVSALDMFTIGLGPSSSHTVGPMRAAAEFAKRLKQRGLLHSVSRLQVSLYGSLALTGRGHGTDRAILIGLMAELPESVDPETIDGKLEAVRKQKQLLLNGTHLVDFFEPTDLLFEGHCRLPLHSNGMRMSAMDRFGRYLEQEVYYSVGGGFVLTEEQLRSAGVVTAPTCVPYPFTTMNQLKEQARVHRLSLLELLKANEQTFRSCSEMEERAQAIWRAMRECTQRGLVREGILPGGLQVRRRAATLWKLLNAERAKLGLTEAMEWLSVYALAVNEENAAGGRVVTAPTNGAAGVIPAVMHYLIDHELKVAGSAQERELARDFLLIAGALGVLYKMGASISAAEAGCQGEIGVASSMAAGAYCAALGGSLAQIEAASEIAMEHHLGLTCDPVAGLVQIPCIERNTMGAVKAVTAARLALRGDGQQKVGLDQVIRTMLQTGRDMNAIYKETSLGGLAVNVAEC